MFVNWHFNSLSLALLSNTQRSSSSDSGVRDLVVRSYYACSQPETGKTISFEARCIFQSFWFLLVAWHDYLIFSHYQRTFNLFLLWYDVRSLNCVGRNSICCIRFNLVA